MYLIVSVPESPCCTKTGTSAANDGDLASRFTEWVTWWVELWVLSFCLQTTSIAVPNRASEQSIDVQ